MPNTNGLNAVTAAVEVALRRLVLPSGPFQQVADLRDGPGQIGNILLHVGQSVRDTPQFIQEKNQ